MADAPAPTAASPEPSAAPQGTANAIPAQATPAVPAAVEPAPDLPPRFSELGKRFAAQKAENEEKAQREADARDAKAYRELLAHGLSPRQAAAEVQQAKVGGRRVELDLDELVQNPGLLRSLLADDAAFRSVLNGAAKSVTAPGELALRKELEALKAKKPEGVDELRAQLEQLQADREAERRSTIEQAFIARTEAKGEGEAAKYPLTSKLPAAQRLELGHAIAQEYRQAGVDPGKVTHDFLASQVEEYLAGLAQTLGLGGGLATPTPAPAAAPATQRPKAPPTPQRKGSQGSRSLTNADATPQGSRRPATDKERRQLAIERHKARRAAARAG